jgi:uncharacterized membrane protein
MSTVCPICGNDDAIQKLTAIVSSGEASGTFSGPSVGVVRVEGKWGTAGGYTTLSGTTKTALAQRLSPPPEPALGMRGLRLKILAILLPFGGAFICGVCTLASVVSLPATAILAIGGIVYFVITIAATIILWQRGITAKAEDETKYADEKAAWDQAMEKYSRAYYCFRDHMVFDPGKGQICQPESLQEYLYSAG